MEKWKKMSYLVAAYLFVIDLRPLDSYLTAYQIGPNVNLSLGEVANTLLLIQIYAALFGSLVMSITADYFLYKPNIIFLSVCSFFSYLIIIGSPSLLQIEVATVGVGVMHSANMVAFSYLYAQIEDINQFQMATGIVSAAAQLGKVIGDFLAEVIVNTTGGVYTALPYCNVFSMFVAVVLACLFPTIVQKKSFVDENVPNEKSQLLKHDKENTTEYHGKTHDREVLDNKNNIVIYVSKEIWTNFKTSYSNPIVLKTSLWYVFGWGTSILVFANVNMLYSYVVEMPGNHDKLSNGFSEGLVTLFGALGAYMIGKVRLDWIYYGDMFTTFCSIAMGVLMVSCYFFKHLFLIYTSYILYGLISQAHAVIIVSEIAKQLEHKCYSLVLVFNFLGSNLFATTMITFFTQDNFLNITIPGRFLFIGILFVILGIIFLFLSVHKVVKKNIII